MKKYAKAIYWGLPISLILAISIILHLGWINAFDNFFEGLVHIVPNLKGLMLKITFLADTKVDLVWMVLIAVILWFRKQCPLATNLVLTMITGDAVGWVIKHLIQRARPVQHLAVDDGFSFPSGHTLGMGMIVIWIIMVLLPVVLKDRIKRFWIDFLLIVWLVIVMISRVYVYAHYPSDVCGSVAIALTWVAVMQFVFEKIKQTINK